MKAPAKSLLYDRNYLRAMLARGERSIKDNLRKLERHLDDQRFAHKHELYRARAQQLRDLLKLESKIGGISNG